MTTKSTKQEKAILAQEGIVSERARVSGLLKRHAREFRSREDEIDKRVADAIDGILVEIESGVQL